MLVPVRQANAVTPSISQPVPQNEVGTYPVAKNCMVRLLATGPVTQRAIEALIKQLQVAVDLGLYPDESDEAATQASQ
jgi:hypothetical protein